MMDYERETVDKLRAGIMVYGESEYYTDLQLADIWADYSVHMFASWLVDDIITPEFAIGLVRGGEAGKKSRV